MKNKKASSFLPTKTLDLVLAVIVIGLIFLIVWKFLGTFLQENEERQAKALLEEIKKTIEYLENNPEIEDDSVILVNPDEWYIVAEESQGIVCVCPENNFNSCNQRDLCYLTGYELDFLGEDYRKKEIKIGSYKENDENLFRIISFYLDKGNREIGLDWSSTREEDFPVGGDIGASL